MMGQALSVDGKVREETISKSFKSLPKSRLAGGLLHLQVGCEKRIVGALTRFHRHRLEATDVPKGQVDERKVTALNVKRLGFLLPMRSSVGSQQEMATPPSLGGSVARIADKIDPEEA